MHLIQTIVMFQVASGIMVVVATQCLSSAHGPPHSDHEVGVYLSLPSWYWTSHPHIPFPFNPSKRQQQLPVNRLCHYTSITGVRRSLEYINPLKPLYLQFRPLFTCLRFFNKEHSGRREIFLVSNGKYSRWN